MPTDKKYAVTKLHDVWMLDNAECSSAERLLATEMMRALNIDHDDWRTRDKLVHVISPRLTGMLDYVADDARRQILRQTGGSVKKIVGDDGTVYTVTGYPGQGGTLYECSEWHKKAAQQLRERVAEVHFNCVGHAELVTAIARHERFAQALQTHLLAFPGSSDVGPGSKAKRHISKKPGKSK